MNKLMRAEWIKFSTLRINWGMLVVAFVLDIALLVIGLIFFNRSLGDSEPVTDADTRIETITGPLGVFATVVSILGVLIMASEYKSKTVIPTFATAPIRSEVVAAKAIVIAVVAFVGAVVGMLVNWIVGAITLDARGFPVDIADDHFVQALGGSVLFVVLATLFGFGLGVLFKNSVLSIVLVVAIPAVAEPALSGFLPDWIDRYLPFAAGSAMVTPGGTDQLPPWEGGGVFGLWAIALIIVAAMIFERRDLGNTD
jgi:ABC-2 type transport system permease protein